MRPRSRAPLALALAASLGEACQYLGDIEARSYAPAAAAGAAGVAAGAAGDAAEGATSGGAAGANAGSAANAGAGGDAGAAGFSGAGGPQNLLGYNTGTLEGTGTGYWEPWFSTKISRSTEQAEAGKASLRVDVTADNGWGVNLDNAPGFPAKPGPMALSFWARSGTANAVSVTMAVTWNDGDSNKIRTDSINLKTVLQQWQKGSTKVTAPDGTVTVAVDFTNDADVGDVIFLDEIAVDDESIAAGAAGAAGGG